MRTFTIIGLMAFVLLSALSGASAQEPIQNQNVTSTSQKGSPHDGYGPRGPRGEKGEPGFAGPYVTREEFADVKKRLQKLEKDQKPRRKARKYNDTPARSEDKPLAEYNTTDEEQLEGLTLEQLKTRCMTLMAENRRIRAERAYDNRYFPTEEESREAREKILRSANDPNHRLNFRRTLNRIREGRNSPLAIREDESEVAYRRRLEEYYRTGK